MQSSTCTHAFTHKREKRDSGRLGADVIEEDGTQTSGMSDSSAQSSTVMAGVSVIASSSRRGGRAVLSCPLRGCRCCCCLGCLCCLCCCCCCCCCCACSWSFFLRTASNGSSSSSSPTGSGAGAGTGAGTGREAGRSARVRDVRWGPRAPEGTAAVTVTAPLRGSVRTVRVGASRDGVVAAAGGARLRSCASLRSTSRSSRRSFSMRAWMIRTASSCSARLSSSRARSFVRASIALVPLPNTHTQHAKGRRSSQSLTNK